MHAAVTCLTHAMAGTVALAQETPPATGGGTGLAAGEGARRPLCGCMSWETERDHVSIRTG